MDPTHSQTDASQLLSRVVAGDRDGMDRLFGVVYDELRRIAAGKMRGERQEHTLSPTALAHEAYFKLIGQKEIDIRDRAHFLALAATAMRRVLVDHARTKRRLRRGGGAKPVELDEQIAFTAEDDLVDVLSLEEALERLAEKNERQSRVVEMRLFGGLSIEETASALSVSTSTVDNDWAISRAWLRRELSKEN
ncbi:MAG: sigma-70 family RNA polymerase sigma factor [Planctomycetota bacterium]